MLYLKILDNTNDIKKLKSTKKYIKVLISSTVKTHVEVLIDNLIIHVTLNKVVTQINNISLKSTVKFCKH